MKSKVLIITYYWPPGGGSGVQRWVKFTKYLPQFGIEPVVLTVSNPTYASWDESLESDIPASTPVYHTKSFEPFGIYSAITGKSRAEVANPSTQIESGASFIGKMASRIRANVFVPDARIGWLPSARKKALELIEEHFIQTVITTGPPHSTHLIGKYVKKRVPVKWIADFRDPWTKIFYNESLNRSGLAASLDLKLEQSVLKTADEVIVTAPSMKKLQRSISKRSYTYISNGFDPEDFTTEAAGKPNPAQDAFTIRHIGTLPESSIPYGLFRALGQLEAKESFRLELIGNVHPDVRQLIDKYSLHNKVFIRSYVPHQVAIKLMKSSDLLLLIIPQTSQNQNIIPGKLFEYIGSNRPVMSIGAKDGDAADIIKNLHQGTAFDHSDISGQAEFLQRAIRGIPDYHRFTGNREPGPDHPYSRLSLTKQLAGLILSNDNTDHSGTDT